MEKETMTIHRGLSELKLIDKRIMKSIAEIRPSGFQQKGKLVNGFYEREAFETDAKSKLQSIEDLIERKSRIKSAIVEANGKTTVEIAGKKMRIADAINFKASIDVKRELIRILKSKHDEVKGRINVSNEKLNEQAIRLAETALSKDNVKINDNDAVAITKPFIEANETHLIDPLKIDEYTETKQKEIDDFESEVDAVLSEINAVTIITI